MAIQNAYTNAHDSWNDSQKSFEKEQLRVTDSEDSENKND
jgi:hypothetical protein